MMLASLRASAVALRARFRQRPSGERIRAADVTIIVLNWNRRDDTLACLESLVQANLDGATVMVVDNGSRDGSVEAVRARFPEVRVVALPENHGFAGGN